MRGAGRRDIVDLEGTRFDPESGDLEGPSGSTGRLAPQPGRLLELLVERRGSVVARDDIADHLWPGGSVEVDAGIGFAVREIRKALEGVGGKPELIETIPRRGYRLRAAPRPPGAEAPAPSEPTFPVARLASSLVLWILAVTALGLVASRLGLFSGGAPTAAVFPYAVDGERAGAVGADELAALVTTRLSREFEGRLGIIGPNGVADLAGPNDTDGAAALGACLVLSGSVRTAVDTGLIIFTQVVRTSDRVHVWAQWDTVAPGESRDDLLDAIAAGVESSRRDCR